MPRGIYEHKTKITPKAAKKLLTPSGKDRKLDGPLRIPCCSVDPTSGLHCTRHRGHFGPHVACSYLNHDLAVWENKETPKRPDYEI